MLDWRSCRASASTVPSENNRTFQVWYVDLSGIPIFLIAAQLPHTSLCSMIFVFLSFINATRWCNNLSCFLHRPHQHIFIPDDEASCCDSCSCNDISLCACEFKMFNLLGDKSFPIQSIASMADSKTHQIGETYDGDCVENNSINYRYAFFKAESCSEGKRFLIFTFRLPISDQREYCAGYWCVIQSDITCQWNFNLDTLGKCANKGSECGGDTGVYDTKYVKSNKVCSSFSLIVHETDTPLTVANLLALLV